MSNVQSKFQAVRSYLNSVVLEREEEIDNMLTCIISGQHVFYLGLPGIGKSFMITEFLKCIDEDDDMSYFSKLLTAHTDISEIFGPVSISGLKQDRLEYNTDGFLADVEVAFLDEIWKSNSQVLNSLLTIMQERRFANGNKNIDAPLISVFAASNELPADDSLSALYDRFICRMHVRPLQQQNNFIALLASQSIPLPNLLTRQDLSEARIASAQVNAVPIFQHLYDLRQKLSHETDIYVSDRRWKSIVKFLQARAFLLGSTELDEDYMQYLLDCIWDNPDQRSDVANILSTFVSPVVSRVQGLFNEAQALLDLAINCADTNQLGSLYSELKQRRSELESKVRDNPSKGSHLQPTLDKFDESFIVVKKRYSALMGL